MLESSSLPRKGLVTDSMATGLAMLFVMLLMLVGLLSVSPVGFGSHSSCDLSVTLLGVTLEQNVFRSREDVSDIKRYMFQI